MIPEVLFFLKIVLSIQGFLCLHTNLKIICSSSGKNAIGIFFSDILIFLFLFFIRV